MALISLVGGKAPAKSAETEPGYVFSMEHFELGPETLTVSSKGVRLDEPMLQLVFVASSPNWLLQAYCPREKTMFICDGRTTEFPIRKPEGPLTTATSSLNGLTVRKYRWVRGPTSKFRSNAADLASSPLLANTSQRIALPNNTKDPIVSRYELLRTNDLKIPAAAYEIINRISRTPCDPGIPIQCNLVGTNGSVVRPWHLVQWKKQAVSSSIFELPKSLKMVASFHDIMRSGAKQRLEELGDALGIGDGFGKGEK